MRKKRKYTQGIFRPSNESKYVGNSKPVYRSSLELKLMRWCDHNPAVVKWGSESIVLPYANPLTGRTSRYFVDFHLTLKTAEGEKKFLIEVKPFDQTMPPKPGKRGNTKAHIRRLQEYAKNTAKWAAAREWSKKKGYTFALITEKELKGNK